MKRLMIKLKLFALTDWLLSNRRILVFGGLVIMAIIGIIHVFGRLFYFGVCMYVAWYVWKHREELQETRLVDWINPVKWGSVVWASFMKIMFPIHIVEQLILRMYDMECRKCVENGSCLHCGCDISKVYTPWDWCSKGNWGAMVEDAREYEKIREEWPVEVSIRYPRET